ncbi:lipoate--protein ligase family protein [Salirhabdus sp. Marseille-P4669]|uniref:lipoate--protein ligase family protein n=1 Tax=Salirhabdus sp. Marseille-P4669 TaxID=2042310 RepID=UPI00358F06D1
MMTNPHALLHVEHIRIIDQSKETHLSAMKSFATDDALCLSVSEQYSPQTARLWVHDKTIVLGIPDSRLPYLHDGVSYLEKEGFQVVVRNSGGLAVVLDEGVLNLSFVFPEAKKLSIHAGYEAMVSFIQALFEKEGKSIEAFEVVGSYCPGDYDLSIGGRKFAGISQRRVKNGTAVQIYICVTGSGAERAALVRTFYDIALQGESHSFDYPTIQPNTMASLQELFDRPITVEEVCKDIIQRLTEFSRQVSYEALHDQEIEWYEKRLNQMVDRNEKAFATIEKRSE